ncbi:DUF885 domain-containing protein [Streptomyces sp. NPDC002067]
MNTPTNPTNHKPATNALNALSDRYIDELAALDPCLASAMGIAGQEEHLTDFSPRATWERQNLARRTLTALNSTPVTGEAGHIAAAVLRERLTTEVALADADAYGTLLDTLDGPVQRIRQAIGLLDQGNATVWEALLARLSAIPATLTGLHESLETARHRKRVAPLRQVTRNARECLDMRAYLTTLPPGHGHGPLRHALDEATTAANTALTRLASYLTDELAPHAPEHDAVGEDRYHLGVQEFLGTRLDLHDVYTWGWDELTRIQQETTQAAARIAPDEPLPAVLAALDNDPRHQATSPAAFRDWIQQLAENAINDLDGTHFTIPPPLRHIDCRIAPNQGVAFYLAPSEDHTRPGTVWWPHLPPDTPIPTWRVPSTMFHEGVPGHHLQLGITTLNPHLNRFQRLTSELHPGHVEGWALYAERLMDELGYFQNPAHRLGMLTGGQQLRAARVILDIGLHLQLPIPPGTGFHEGQHWTPHLAHTFLTQHCQLGPPDFLTWEIDRYLGRPAQALAYKLGEKTWLQARHTTQHNLTTFHHHALQLPPMGLNLLHTHLTTPTPQNNTNPTSKNTQ